jgi:hypothetical protein
VKNHVKTQVNIPKHIEAASGKLGVMLVGMGAVSTTTIAGVLAIRGGLAKPIGSCASANAPKAVSR